MIEPFTYHGFWWLPDNEQVKVFGELEFTPKEGGTLTLAGPSTELNSFVAPAFNKITDVDDVFKKKSFLVMLPATEGR